MDVVVDGCRLCPEEEDDVYGDGEVARGVGGAG